MSLDAPQIILLVLLFLPAVAAVVVALLGHAQGNLVRQISAATSVVSIVLAFILAGQFMAKQNERPAAERMAWLKTDHPTFKPEFVPGSTPEDPHRTTWNVL